MHWPALSQGAGHRRCAAWMASKPAQSEHLAPLRIPLVEFSSDGRLPLRSEPSARWWNSLSGERHRLGARWCEPFEERFSPVPALGTCFLARTVVFIVFSLQIVSTYVAANSQLFYCSLMVFATLLIMKARPRLAKDTWDALVELVVFITH